MKLFIVQPNLICFCVGVVGFEPTEFLMCGFYRPVPIRHLSSTPIFTEREVNFPYISPVLLLFEKLRWAVSSPLKTIPFGGNVTSTFTAFLLVSAVIYQVLLYVTL